MCIQEVYGISYPGCGHFREVGTKERDCLLGTCALSSTHTKAYGRGPCTHPGCRRKYRVVLKQTFGLDDCTECPRRRPYRSRAGTPDSRSSGSQVSFY
ncbi:hypothetical protein M407DRAFT_240713 [Tulasnella calospora MUT 4182]|uniref:Uncharacterized protein n=1 Tax=Tulasnella calospora MUT 4182 TaxID=1051891 RepID=A0A0C3LK60_9AGAM|nr:hypothetical protein M407DRAFT_240713 [Tulasnella calospora MUT 4182]